MSLVTLPRCEHEPQPPGTWRIYRTDDGRPGSVIVRCPRCERRGVLRRLLDHSGHAIANDGTVHPSLQCGTTGCTWHVHVQLADWRPLDA